MLLFFDINFLINFYLSNFLFFQNSKDIIFQILKIFYFLKEIINVFYMYLSHYFLNIHHFLFSKTIYLFLINIFICKYLEF